MNASGDHLEFDWESSRAVGKIYAQDFATETVPDLEDLDRKADKGSPSKPAAGGWHGSWTQSDRPLRKTHLIPGMALLLTGLAYLDPKYRLYCFESAFVERLSTWKATMIVMVDAEANNRVTKFLEESMYKQQREVPLGRILSSPSKLEEASPAIYGHGLRLFRRSTQVIQTFRKISTPETIKFNEYTLLYPTPTENTPRTIRPVIRITGAAPLKFLASLIEGSNV